jgi:hypothetical protein
MKSQNIRKYIVESKTIIHDCFRTELINEGQNDAIIKQDNCDDIVLKEGDSISFGGDFVDEGLTNNAINIVFLPTEVESENSVLLIKKYLILK